MTKLYSYETWFDQGMALQESNKHAEALDCFQKAIEIKSDFIPAWVYQGISLEQLQQHDEALATFDKAIQINSGVMDLWYNKGATLCEMKRYKEALDCFDKALEIEPNNPVVQTTRSLTLEILESLKQLQRLTPQDINQQQPPDSIVDDNQAVIKFA